MSRATRTLDAVWEKLEEDDAMTLLLQRGTLYKFKEDELLRKLLFESNLCPILAIAPAAAGSKWRPARRRRGSGLADSFAFQVEGATKGVSYGSITTLAEGFRDFIERQIAAGFGLGADEPDEIEFESLGFEPQPNKDSVVESWVFRVTCVCRYRVS